MGRRIVAGFVVAFGALVFAAGDASSAGDEGVPLPLEKTKVFPSGQRFTVEGRVRIPKGVSITLQKDTMVCAKGDAEAVIEVEGELQVHGVTGSRDVFRGVAIEPQAKFGQLLLDMVDFDGNGVGVRTPPDTPVDGRIFIQNTSFTLSATVDVTMCANDIDLQQISCSAPIRVKAVDPKGSTFNKVKLMVMNCLGKSSFGLSGGLTVEHVADSCVRANVLGGEKVTFSDCGVVTFDANYVTCRTLEFVQSAPGQFGKTDVSKCDLQIGKLLAYVPYVEGKAETLSVEHCWFDGEAKAAGIRDRFVKDRSSDPKCGVTVEITKPLEKPQQLGWTVKK